jgi:Ca2+-binding EF-hand superfamily protein
VRRGDCCQDINKDGLLSEKEVRSLITSIATADAVTSHEDIPQAEIDRLLRHFRNFDSDGVRP